MKCFLRNKSDVICFENPNQDTEYVKKIQSDINSYRVTICTKRNSLACNETGNSWQVKCKPILPWLIN